MSKQDGISLSWSIMEASSNRYECYLNELMESDEIKSIFDEPFRYDCFDVRTSMAFKYVERLNHIERIAKQAAYDKRETGIVLKFVCEKLENNYEREHFMHHYANAVYEMGIDYGRNQGYRSGWVEGYDNGIEYVKKRVNEL